jgi:uncharacterized protein (DUF1800 family)
VNHALAHRFRKIEWLKESKVRDEKWLFGEIPRYEPLPLRPVLEEQCMVSEDLAEQKRLYDQDKAGGFINNWLNYFREVDNPLREYATLFWHEHIPCGSRGSRTEVHLQQNQLTFEMYRKHALGDLASFLKAYYRNPSCMYFLDIHRSYKENPNENFARELMELYTLGDGNYTLDDVKEVAKAFTGLHFDPDDYSQASYFVEAEFDSSEKNILGHIGHFGADDVIDIILKQKQCAMFISKKALLFFCGDVPSEAAVKECAEVYYQSGYVFLDLIKAITKYIPPNPQKVKSPIEHLVFLQRQMGLRTVGHKTNQYFLRLSGQYPLSPWSVAGWTHGRDWLLGEHLMHRTFFPLLLLDICNREEPRDSRKYKLVARIRHTRLKKIRYLMDAKWNREAFESLLEAHGLTASKWLLGEDLDLNFEEVLVQEKFQYC